MKDYYRNIFRKRTLPKQHPYRDEDLRNDDRWAIGAFVVVVVATLALVWCSGAAR